MAVEMRGRDVVQVACPCGWDNGGRLVLVDRYQTDWPPIPAMEILELYSDDVMDPDDRVDVCPACTQDLDPYIVIERWSWRFCLDKLRILFELR